MITEAKILEIIERDVSFHRHTGRSPGIYLTGTKAAASAIFAALSSPLQGREPTEEMLLAGEEAYWAAPKDEDGCTAMAAAYRAMLGKAQPPVQSVEVGLVEALKHCTERLQNFLDTFGDLGGCVTQADLNDWNALLASPSSPEEWRDEELSPELEAIRRDTQAKIAIAMMGVYPTRKYHVSIRRLPAPPAAKGDEQ